MNGVTNAAGAGIGPDTLTMLWRVLFEGTALTLVIAGVIAGIVWWRRRQQREQRAIEQTAHVPVALPNMTEWSHLPRLNQVAGLDAVRDDIERLVHFLKHPQAYQAMGARMPRGVLLYGPPGTGKTLLASALAREAEVPFFPVTGSEFIEKYVGTGAQRVRDLFAQARKVAPAVIFIDEIDAVALPRHQENPEHHQTVNQLLAEMDGIRHKGGAAPVLVIAATNHVDSLDPAILRPGRFDRKIGIPLPDADARRAILAVHLNRVPHDPAVDLNRLAHRLRGVSGADLENLINEAAILAVQSGAPRVEAKHFAEAEERILVGIASPKRLSPAEQRRIAVHEAGHAVMAWILGRQIDRITILGRGEAGGYVQSGRSEDLALLTKDDIMEDVIIALGGRAAEVAVYGTPSLGAQNDLEQAGQWVVQAVAHWALADDTTGLVVGRLVREQDRDRAVRAWIDEAWKRTEGLLGQYRSLHAALVEQLLEKETLDGEEAHQWFEAHRSLRVS